MYPPLWGREGLHTPVPSPQWVSLTPIGNTWPGRTRRCPLLCGASGTAPTYTIPPLGLPIPTRFAQDRGDTLGYTPRYGGGGGGTPT